VSEANGAHQSDVPDPYDPDRHLIIAHANSLPLPSTVAADGCPG